MSLSDLAAVGSFVSGVAVLISFVFLAVQLRQSAHNQRASVHNERATLTQDIGLAIASDKEASELWRRGNEADPSLDAAEGNQYFVFAISAFWAYEEFFYQHQDGMIDQARWATNARRFRTMIAAPGFRAAWRVAASGYFESDFANWVEKIMREAPVTPGSSTLGRAWKEAARLELAAAATQSTT